MGDGTGGGGGGGEDVSEDEDVLKADECKRARACCGGTGRRRRSFNLSQCCVHFLHNVDGWSFSLA